MSVAPRTIRIAPTSTIAMTIHIVRIVLLIDGWMYTPTAGGAAAFGSKSMTEWGAGNSRLFWMKQAGKEQDSPAAPPRGAWGNAMNAKMSTRITPAIRRNQ